MCLDLIIQRTRRKHLPRLGSPLSAELKEFGAMLGRDTDLDANDTGLAVAFPAGFYVFSVLLFGTWHDGFSRNEKPPRRAAVFSVVGKQYLLSFLPPNLDGREDLQLDILLHLQ